MLWKQQLSCCLACKGLGGEGWGGVLAWSADPGAVKRQKEQMHSCRLEGRADHGLGSPGGREQRVAGKACQG